MLRGNTAVIMWMQEHSLRYSMHGSVAVRITIWINVQRV